MGIIFACVLMSQSFGIYDTTPFFKDANEMEWVKGNGFKIRPKVKHVCILSPLQKSLITPIIKEAKGVK